MRSHTPCCIKEQKTIDKRIQDYCLRTNLDLFLLCVFVALYSYRADAASTTSDVNQETTDENVPIEVETGVPTVFFPWFTQVVGIFVYYVLSRYAGAIPFTAVMFLIGLVIGVAVEEQGGNNNEHLDVASESAAIWMSIPGELLLMVFLPGLLYVDAYGIDVHLFFKSLSQVFIFAFPMVLAGTVLTALVAYYVFPYGWSFDLCMTFGAILSATDPVAVSVLMNELGAPPRLQMHIAGESLLNDGSAYVFFYIFRARTLYQLNLTNVGQSISWGEGFKLFFQLSLGSVCIGLAFGIGTVIVLYKLQHRLSGDDSVAQVVLTISVAYLTYFVSDLAHCSGVIGVLFLGISVKAFGESLINNSHLMHHFWEITEWLLNTLLFTLAGCVFGGVLIDSDKQTAENERLFEPRDWGYLFVLFFLLQAVRFFLIFSFYPLTSVIGISTSWQEAVFMGYSGLRGAVGIALSLSLTAEVYQLTPDLVYRDNSAKVFFFVGGTALLTLIINAPTCGIVLKKLGLVTPTETRLKIIAKHRRRVIQHSLTEYVSLLSEKRFYDLDFTVVREHVPFLKDVTYEQLKYAVKCHHEKTPPRFYVHPNLLNVVPYLNRSSDDNFEGEDKKTKEGRNTSIANRLLRSSLFHSPRNNSIRMTRDSTKGSIFDLRKHPEVELVAHEERLIFIQAVRSAYHYLIQMGEVESRGFLPYSLFRSLDYAQDKAARGQPLADWEALCVASDSFASHFKVFFLRSINLRCFNVQKILAFIKAHTIAERVFKDHSLEDGRDELTRAENIVLEESLQQVNQAEEALAAFDENEVRQIKSHYACHIILNKAAAYYERLSREGLMSEREAGEFIEEIESNIRHLNECQNSTHVGELSEGSKLERMPNDQWSLIHLRGNNAKCAVDTDEKNHTV